MPAWTLNPEFPSSDVVACLLHKTIQISIFYINVYSSSKVSTSDKAVNLRDKMSRGLRVREGCNSHRVVNSQGLLPELTLTQRDILRPGHRLPSQLAS